MINIIFNRLLTLLDANSFIDWLPTALDGSNIRALRCAAG
ncbi:putative transposase, partial [Candidatus Erwinia dacicola]